MPPVLSGDESFETESGSCSATGACAQVLLGCLLPMLAVASFIPLMLLKRYLDYKVALKRLGRCDAEGLLLKIEGTSATVPPTTPRVPIKSVYLARVNYYLPAINTLPSMDSTVTVYENASDIAISDLEVASSSECRALVSEMSQTLSTDQSTPLLSLPSLPSILCEFTAYADAIEADPESFAEARRSSTCLLSEGRRASAFLLDEAFSSMDSNALSLSTAVGSSTASYPRDMKIISGCFVQTSCLALSPSSVAQSVNELEQVFPILEGRNNNTAIPSSIHLFAGSEEGDPFVEMDVESLCNSQVEDAEEIQEISTSQMQTSTTVWSVLLNSFSTLGSLRAVRLEDFPSVPSFVPQPLGFGVNRFIPAPRSDESLLLSLSHSLSAPASLNLLEIRLEDGLLPIRISDDPYLVECPDFSGPGELWDEDDEALFAPALQPQPIETVRMTRNTWTAGIVYSRSQKGDLWDDDDDRRLSSASQFDALSTFASLSVRSLQIDNDSIVRFASLVSNNVFTHWGDALRAECMEIDSVGECEFGEERHADASSATDESETTETAKCRYPYSEQHDDPTGGDESDMSVSDKAGFRCIMTLILSTHV